MNFIHHKKGTKLIIKKDEKYAVECQIKIALDCIQTGEFLENEEEAVDWVEEECWINSGEGWICTQCHEQILKNIANLGKLKGQ